MIAIWAGVGREADSLLLVEMTPSSNPNTHDYQGLISTLVFVPMKAFQFEGSFIWPVFQSMGIQSYHRHSDRSMQTVDKISCLQLYG